MLRKWRICNRGDIRTCHRLHETDVALLNQVQELQASVGVLLSNGDNQTQVGLDHLFLGAASFGFADGHGAADFFDFSDINLRVILDLDELFLQARDIARHFRQGNCVSVALLEVAFQPLQVSLVLRERFDENITACRNLDKYA